MTETKISVLIFSMNKVDRVIQLATKLRDFVDEIVVVDSSKKRNYELLKRKIPFAKVYWVPPIGVVELYYQLGLNITRNKWVLHLEDDEKLNEEFLRNLKKIISKSDAQVYRVTRIDTRLKTKQKLIRLFNKKYVVATGCIHWCWASKVDYKDLDEKYIIYHHTEDLAPLKKRIKRLWNFSIIESYQWGYKILYTLFNDDLKKSEEAGKEIKNIAKKIFQFQTKLGSIGWYLIATEYNLYWLIYGLFKVKKVPLESFLYWLFIQINITIKFRKKLKIWKKMFECGNPIKFMNLESVNSIRKIKVSLSENNGLKNFCKILESKILYF